MARLTESQRRRMREEAARRRRLRMAPLSDADMASFLNVTYVASTWSSDCGGYDSTSGTCSSDSSGSGSSWSDSSGSSYSSSDSGSSFSCGGSF